MTATLFLCASQGSMSCSEFSDKVTDKLKQHAKSIRSCAIMATGLPCRNPDPHRFETQATSVAIRPIPERPGTLATVCWATRQAYLSLMSNSSVHRPCAAACYLMCCMRYACVNSMVDCETAVACLVPLLVPVPPPRWPGVREEAVSCAGGQRSVSDRV